MPEVFISFKQIKSIAEMVEIELRSQLMEINGKLDKLLTENLKEIQNEN
jgi:hypothetical protein